MLRSRGDIGREMACEHAERGFGTGLAAMVFNDRQQRWACGMQENSESHW
jgi:hypothetical protein